MKKILFIASVLFLGFNGASFADEDMWVTLGYGYYIPEEGGKAPLGPVNLTIGGQVTDWVAIDFSIGYFWGFENKEKAGRIFTDIDSLPVRLHFMVQPSFDAGYFDILPYLGIGPAIAVNGTNFSNADFSYGFSAKAGLRFIENGFLFGIGAEYIYNHLDISYGGFKNKYNTSGISVGAEIGYAF